MLLAYKPVAYKKYKCIKMKYLHIHINADEHKSAYYYIYEWIHKNVHKKAQNQRKNYQTLRTTEEEKKLVLIFLKLHVSRVV